MMNFSRTALLIALSGTVLTGTAQAATLSNGSFEQNFTGWNRTGNTSIQNASSGINPVDGTNQALLTNAGAATGATGLEDFFELTAGTLNGLGVFNGAGISQSFTANAGDTLSLSWNFLTNEPPTTVTNDFAFVVLNGVTTLADTNSSLLGASSSIFFDSDTGYQTFNFTFATSGIFTLGLGVANVGDAQILSGLLVDQVTVTPAAVPEPATVLGTLALGGLALLKKGTRKQS